MCFPLLKLANLVRLLCLSILLSLSITSIQGQDETLPPAPINNDEGGTVSITGQLRYSNPYFTLGVSSPVIILEDQAGFIDRNRYFVLPPESQTLGQITSDFYASPVSYRLALPIEPNGTRRDVDNNGVEDIGVMVFAVAYWTNTWGDPYLETRDLGGGGWSTIYASTRASIDPALAGEIIGGKFIIYAPDDMQGFPAAFGDDGLLFTADDPIVRLPQGYTVVDMDTSPFSFDRSRYSVIDLIEPEEAVSVDFSTDTYTNAFENMTDLLRDQYAFTEYKGIDWDALHDTYLPRFAAAEAENDTDAYLLALRDFLWQIPDGQIRFYPFTPYVEAFQYSLARGLGLGLNETDDGRILITVLIPDGPAEMAGIELGAELLAINGQAIETALQATKPWSAPFSTSHSQRIQQLRYVVRFDAETESVELTYRNPGSSEDVTMRIATSNETESFNATSIVIDRGAFPLPVEYELNASGYGYVTISSFSDNALLTIQLWERMMQDMNSINVPGIIIDMRQNGGGNGFLADQLSGYFFNESHIVGNIGFYSPELDDFYFDPRSQRRMFLPPEELRYTGEIAVLIGPSCASACERFVYNLTIDDRAAIVGQYPTAGIGGAQGAFIMPEGINVSFSIGRTVDANGNIHIEGWGIAPTVIVPINENTLFNDDDAVLNAAIQYLNQ